MKAFITGLAGPVLLAGERDFLRDARPCGVIFFDRNIENPQQLRRLVDDYLQAVGVGPQLVLIDQEGGRIQRMRAPHWRKWPAAARYGELYAKEPTAAVLAAQSVYRMMCEELVDVGVNVNCVPLLDVPVAGAHDIIGDRAFGGSLEAIIDLGRGVAKGCLAGGVLPVIKHIPGHGRATADSHVNLPMIDASLEQLQQHDFQTFRALNDLPLGMTGHLLMTALDPVHNVSVSKKIIDDVIRGWIGFDGLLMSDDLSMKALSGSIGERAEGVLAAGCDVALYCKGVFGEMQAGAEAAPELQGGAKRRFDAAVELIRPPEDYDRAEAEALLKRLVGS